VTADDEKPRRIDNAIRAEIQRQLVGQPMLGRVQMIALIVDPAERHYEALGGVFVQTGPVADVLGIVSKWAAATGAFLPESAILGVSREPMDPEAIKYLEVVGDEVHFGEMLLRTATPGGV